ncbi:exonuclease SbcCD subunit D [Paenibacillus beijingensis]|uniref:Nuclease SbcCD subunit D n=1 Tax=Paenibacillus beijingensis TaxID=1126833 RepID=A0A0D5NSH0_9BACL|nr:exonuclease SbcCD subunit D [Paenibacillus beijingensis]AJY77853.1 DNA repair exonuclease [Paenibacillus beijingensis]
MKFIHTADWHLGKLVQGVYMTEDQRHVLNQLAAAVAEEKPDAVVIAGDLYDRAIPPVEAVELLNELLEKIVVELETPVLAISGNHDSPDRLQFGAKMMERRGLHLAGQLKADMRPAVLRDAYGEVHFHLVPYADPAMVRYTFGDEDIRTHDDAMKAVTAKIAAGMDPKARHVLVGHAFVTPGGLPQANTSESERPLSVGGAEHVHAEYFKPFHYTALGHLHQAHYVAQETVRYAGSPLKYSISEENHRKGYLIVELDQDGRAAVEKREFVPLRDMRRISASIEELESHSPCNDYVFVTLLNDNPVLFPMEKVRAVYPNALHVERRMTMRAQGGDKDAAEAEAQSRSQTDPVSLFASFYREVNGADLSEGKTKLFAEVYTELLRTEGGAV